MSNLKLYCASLVGYSKTSISNQTTHLVAQNDGEAFNKACKIFELVHKDNKVKKYISCIELIDIEGHKIKVE